jgi:hypothetical protein
MDELGRIEKGALEHLKELLKDEPQYESDVIHEIADSHCPIYYSDILQLAADNIFLATTESDIGPAFDGSPTPINIITANIYEHIISVLYEHLEELKEEIEEEKTRCYECDEEIEEGALIGEEIELLDGEFAPVCVECYDEKIAEESNE